MICTYNICVIYTHYHTFLCRVQTMAAGFEISLPAWIVTKGETTCKMAKLIESRML